MPENLHTEGYKNNFYTAKATTDQYKELAYQVRYQVYVKEQGYFSERDVIENCEKDPWDAVSIHSLLFHKASGRLIGCVRLIPLIVQDGYKLPVELHYTHEFNFKNLPIDHLRAGKTGEVSRMAVISDFKRRKEDKEYSARDFGDGFERNKRRYPNNLIPLSLTFAAINLMIEAGLDYAVAIMELRLAKLLTMFGVKLDQIGEPHDYYGLRAPFVIYPELTYQNLKPEYKVLFNVIKEELCSEQSPSESKGPPV